MASKIEVIIARLNEEIRKSELHQNVADSFLARAHNDGIVSSIDTLLLDEHDPQVLALCMAATLDQAVFSEDSHFVEERGQGWVLSTDGTLFLSNPFDLDRRDGLIGALSGKVKDLGVLPNLGDDDVPDVPVMDDQSARDTDRLLDMILLSAVRENSSDIHLRALATEARVRIRRDGRLVDIQTIELGEPYERLINRILTRCRHNGGAYASPTTGKFQFSFNGRSVPVRVEQLPTTTSGIVNPNITMRVFGTSSQLKDLSKLGFPDTSDNPQLTNISAMTRRPNGMILVTGPTGSGKTTTLYAMLGKMIKDAPDLAYYSLEDPVEIELAGVDQIQINEKAGLTYAAGLRSLLRKDPDRILVGEIRDEETMKNATRAGLTGHLVLSTLHTNDGISAIPRLKDLGCDAGRLADTLIGIVAQRVVRKVCQHCADRVTWNQLYSLDHPKLAAAPPEMARSYRAAEFAYVDLPGAPSADSEVLIEGPGCEQCAYQAYRGRRTISETISLDKRMRQMITEDATTGELLEHAKAHCGFVEMWGHAITAVTNQEITLETALSVLEEREIPISYRDQMDSSVRANESSSTVHKISEKGYAIA